MGKQLKRAADRYVLGVCGGIADYFSINPWFVRFIWIIVTIISLLIPGILVYFILSVIMTNPDE